MLRCPNYRTDTGTRRTAMNKVLKIGADRAKAGRTNTAWPQKQRLTSKALKYIEAQIKESHEIDSRP